MRKFNDLKFTDVKDEIFTKIVSSGILPHGWGVDGYWELAPGFIKHGLHPEGAFGAPGSQTFMPFVAVVEAKSGMSILVSVTHLLTDIEL
jgi:hypothetical protein